MKPILSLAVAAALISTALPGHAWVLPAGGASVLAQAESPPAPVPGSAPLPRADAVAAPDARIATRVNRLPGLAGPYLAARQAASDNDFTAAARYFGRAVEVDGTDPFLQDGALVSMVSAGQMDQAVALAGSLPQGEDNTTELAALIRRVDLARQQDWPAVLATLEQNPSTPSAGGPLLDGLFRAWALMGVGRASEAFAELDQLAGATGAAGIAGFQLALAKASVGDYEGAAAALNNPEASSHLQGVIARVQVLSQLERNDEAIAFLDTLDAIENEPVLIDLRQRLQAGETVPFDIVEDPRDGLAQVLVIFGGALMGNEETDPLALLYARLGQYLDPTLPDARLMIAQLLQSAGQFDLAEQEFDALRQAGQMRPAAELVRIDSLVRADRMEAAEAAARMLAEAYPGYAQAWVALGDVLRQNDKFAEAVPVYDRALQILQAEEDPQATWFPLYARAIARERSGDYDGADADFQAALDLQPDQAPILNYLGYSWVDRNVRLDEGLDLIKRAVELRPDDGYILDSLAWAYYRLGRYEEAVEPMERSVAVMSDDSLVNDHMGDIYWMAGRKREAEIQWQRALSLYKPEDTDTDVDRIRAKLEVGLDAVLEAERANGGTLPEGFGLPEPEPAPAAEAEETGEAPSASGPEAPAGNLPPRP
ncbi:tetratricopeptide repeat protein [Paracoccus sp. MC1854]|uniref:tetratricopeptide repeat protein n=1 Tax=Paracoccus sp. MC1854 TaxID=2760306 RepID=UPI0016014A20|nr:tetratricopeptide repeat protein [Paracoccus sp. MC1854]MBB1492560.1 tetratricopeptide repeat protein [Paracoccus sp. MC1854]